MGVMGAGGLGRGVRGFRSRTGFWRCVWRGRGDPAPGPSSGTPRDDIGGAGLFVGNSSGRHVTGLGRVRGLGRVLDSGGVCGRGRGDPAPGPLRQAQGRLSSGTPRDDIGLGLGLFVGDFSGRHGPWARAWQPAGGQLTAAYRDRGSTGPPRTRLSSTAVHIWTERSICSWGTAGASPRRTASIRRVPFS